MLRRPLLALGCLALASASTAQTPAAKQTDLTALSLEELMNTEVQTVSRKPERWWAAPSGVDVVTGEDIRRAGVLNLPDAFRLAVGVHVGQPSKRSWAVSIRGMNVLAANKISAVMDGRSLFTPFFSGVQWDAQDALLEDIDRIEVVRGPVGALWGAFAVNGFIQVLTKSAADTQGLLATAGAGTEDPGFLALRYGGRLGSERWYRAYAKYFQTDWTYRRHGGHAQGATDFLQGGFRFDSRPTSETALTLQGDLYTNQDLPLDRPQTEISGGNLLGRWRRTLSPDSDLQVEGYAERTYRLIPRQFEEHRSTGSLSLRYRRPSGRHALQFGADTLLSGDEIGNIGIALLEPPERTTHVVGAYVQDTFQFRPRAAFVAGAKAEHSSFASWEVQPTLRFVWTPNPRTTAWTGVSRAVRTPVRIDEDLVFRISGVTIFEANDDFKTESATVFEVGGRHRITDELSVIASVFASRYHDLRSSEPAGAAPTPLTFKNRLDAESYGSEATVLYQPHARLLVKASYRYLDLKFTKDAGSADTTNGSAEGNDAKHVAVVAAHLNLPGRLELDGFLRHASALPRPALAGYTTADLRLGWRPSTRWDVSVVGRNLLDRQFAEFVTTNSLNEEVHRSFTAKLTFRR